jgi:hypothetical protein
MKVFASFFKKKRLPLYFARPPRQPRAEFFFENRGPGAKNQKTSMTWPAA